MSDWISVEDRLPEDNVPILAYCPDGGRQFVCQKVRNTKWGSDEYPFLWKVTLLRDYFFDFETFSHWMPLPVEPVKEKTE